MAVRWQCVCIDAVDPRPVADFWENALAWRRTHEDEDEIVLEPPAGSPLDGLVPDLLVGRVPDPKTVKNRLHIDLRPDDQETEVARLESLGARRVSIGQEHDDSVTWVVMADPGGNEFCVLRALPTPG
jgi:predicted enzyme related to lactoylglutathione lyase